MYIDDCVKGTRTSIAERRRSSRINLGSSELVTINQLVDMVEDIAGVKLERSYNLDAPQGVRGRNSDNTLIQETYGWEPSISLREGIGEDLRLGRRAGGAAAGWRPSLSVEAAAQQRPRHRTSSIASSFLPSFRPRARQLTGTSKTRVPRRSRQAERFIRTMLREWAYAAVYGSSPERAAALSGWVGALQLQAKTWRPRSPAADRTATGAGQGNKGGNDSTRRPRGVWRAGGIKQG